MRKQPLTGFAKVLSVLAGLLLTACTDNLSRNSDSATQTTVPHVDSRLETFAAPNVVLIVADDLGWSDLPPYGNTHHITPNIDRLAAEGTRFTSFYAYPVCTPSRVALMTGLNPARVKMTTVIPETFFPHSRVIQPSPVKQLPPGLPALGRLMKDAGYATAYFGKWHLGGPMGDGAVAYGYDRSMVTFGLSHLAPEFRTGPETALPDGTFLGDAITDMAIDFIEQNKQRRFFVEIHHFAPHIPLQARPETEQAVRRRYEKAGISANHLYGAMIEELDVNVGRVVDVLVAQGLDESTLVMFVSDNGGLLKTKRQGLKLRGLGTGLVTTNAPLRDGKGVVYEGGIRVPFIARWPSVVPAGEETDTVASLMDIRPTLAELVQAGFDEGTLQDGSSFLQSLKQPQQVQLRPPLFIHFPHYNGWQPATSVRKDEWKLIHHYEDDSLELYNLENDPEEKVNLAGSYPDIVKPLQVSMQTWLKDVNAAIPTPNPDYDPDRAYETDRQKSLSGVNQIRREFMRKPYENRASTSGNR